MKTNLTYISNSISGGPKLIDADGATIFKSDYAEEVREYCEQNAIETVTFDADGNGSEVQLPVAWIGDGEKLEGSQRTLQLINE